METPATRPTRPAWAVGHELIDCDVHNNVPSVFALFPYLAEHWREHINATGFKGPTDTSYPKAPTSVHPDIAVRTDRPPASRVDQLRADVLDAWGAGRAILNCAYAVDSIHNSDVEVAIARAVNDWQIAEWLDPEPRLRASIVVPIKQPIEAAREIARVAGHPGFVQVLLPVRSAAPYGKRQYHPVFEAAVRHDLVVGLHFGGAPGNPPTSVGWPSYYVEEYTGMAQAFQGQLMSLIVEGVFDQFPALRVTLIEGGFAWLPPFLWRFDKEWKGLRREIPWTKRLPSEYVRQHVRFTTQPLDGPPDPARFERLVAQLGSDDLLLFSTDYPHWHFDTPEEALPAGLPERLIPKVLAANARAWYRFDR